MDFQKDTGCFVCGSDNPRGMQAHFATDAASQSASCVLVIDEAFQGWQGVVHGGIISALLDEAGIYACRACGESFVTAELKVRFRKPLPTGRKLEITARVQQKKRNIFIVTSSIFLEKELHAEGEAKVFCLDP